MGSNEMDYGIICDVGGKGKGNEDSAFLNIFDLIIAPGSPHSKSFAYKGILAIVCDGVSGSAKGEEGSTFAIRCLSSKIMTYLYQENLDIAQLHIKLNEFIQQTNSELFIRFKALIDKENKIPKSTLVGVLIIGQWIWVFNLGDSRAYLVKDGQISQVSVDHIGTVAHEITQAFGEAKIQPAIQVYNWAFNDNAATQKSFQSNYSFLICSDGLTDKVTPPEISAILSTQSENKTMQEKVEKLYDLTMSRNINDNVSIISVDLAKYIKNVTPIQILKLSFD